MQRDSLLSSMDHSGVLTAQRLAASRYAMLAYTLHHVRPIIFCQKITVCNNDRPRGSAGQILESTRKSNHSKIRLIFSRTLLRKLDELCRVLIGL